MEYDAFFAKFGASARTKNILRDAAKLKPRQLARNLRPFALPESSALPLEFIRLCP